MGGHQQCPRGRGITAACRVALIQQEVARRDAFLKWLATEDQTAVYTQLSPAAEFLATPAPGE